MHQPLRTGRSLREATDLEQGSVTHSSDAARRLHVHSRLPFAACQRPAAHKPALSVSFTARVSRSGLPPSTACAACLAPPRGRAAWNVPRRRRAAVDRARARRAAAMFQLGQTSKNSRIARETGRVKKNSGQLRIEKDVSELDTPKSVEVFFPDPDNLMHLALTLAPEEGYYAAGSFDFTITVPPDYPHSPPKVHCETLVYHPNIDLDGNVCLNILRQDWKPVLTLSSVVYGIVLLFLSPNPDDPLNKDAAELLKRNPAHFRRNVDQSLRGGYVSGTMFKNCRR